MKNNFVSFLTLIIFISTIQASFAAPLPRSTPHEKEISSFEKVKAETRPEDYHFRFSSIPQHAWGDIKNTFWGWNGLALILGTGGSLAFLPADSNVRDHFSTDPAFSSKFDKTLGTVLSPYTLGGASAVAFLIGTQVNNPRFSLASESLMESWAMSMALTGALKLAIRRDRPDGGNYSMPSAHAAAAFSTATVLTQFYGLKAALPSYALASLVSFSRIDGNNHNLTDVLIGSVLGTVIGIGTSQFHKKENSQFFIVPEASSKGSRIVVYKAF